MKNPFRYRWQLVVPIGRTPVVLWKYYRESSAIRGAQGYNSLLPEGYDHIGAWVERIED